MALVCLCTFFCGQLTVLAAPKLTHLMRGTLLDAIDNDTKHRLGNQDMDGDRQGHAQH